MNNEDLNIKLKEIILKHGLSRVLPDKIDVPWRTRISRNIIFKKCKIGHAITEVLINDKERITFYFYSKRDVMIPRYIPECDILYILDQLKHYYES